MKINNRLFPYPILSRDTNDYVTDFSTEIIPSTNKNGYSLNVKNHINDEVINNLISEGKATFALHLECKDTRYRKIFKNANNTFSIDIEKNQVLTNIEYCSMILAKEDISKYKNNSLNEDLRDFSYSFSKGEIIGIGANGDMPIENTEDTLSNRSSIVSIVMKNDIDEMNYSYDHRKIYVLLPQKIYEGYTKVVQYPEMKHILLTSLIVPVLSSVMDDIKDSETRKEIENYGWYISMKRWLEDQGYKNLDDLLQAKSIVIAQKLLENPYKRFFNAFEDILENN